MRARALLVALALLAGVGLAACQLAVEFDRSRLEGADDRDAAPSVDGNADGATARDASADANTEPDADAAPDAGAADTDAGADAADTDAGADAAEDAGG